MMHDIQHTLHLLLPLRISDQVESRPLRVQKYPLDLSLRRFRKPLPIRLNCCLRDLASFGLQIRKIIFWSLSRFFLIFLLFSFARRGWDGRYLIFNLNINFCAGSLVLSISRYRWSNRYLIFIFLKPRFGPTPSRRSLFSHFPLCGSIDVCCSPSASVDATRLMSTFAIFGAYFSC